MNQKKKAPKPKEYRRNKRAFDRVMSRLRAFSNIQIGPAGVTKYDGGARGAQRDLAEPTAIDFRCDVMKAIESKISTETLLIKFHIAYLNFDSVDYIEREMHAHKVIGERRHRLEQRIGAEFIRRGIYPTRNYFYFERSN